MLGSVELISYYTNSSGGLARGIYSSPIYTPLMKSAAAVGLIRRFVFVKLVG